MVHSHTFTEHVCTFTGPACTFTGPACTFTGHSYTFTEHSWPTFYAVSTTCAEVVWIVHSKTNSDKTERERHPRSSTSHSCQKQTKTLLQHLLFAFSTSRYLARLRNQPQTTHGNAGFFSVNVRIETSKIPPRSLVMSSILAVRRSLNSCLKLFRKNRQSSVLA